MDNAGIKYERINDADKYRLPLGEGLGFLGPQAGPPNLLIF